MKLPTSSRKVHPRLTKLAVALFAAVIALPLATPLSAIAEPHDHHGGGGGHAHYGPPAGGPPAAGGFGGGRYGGPAPRYGAPAYGGGPPRYAAPAGGYYGRPPGYGPPPGYAGSRFREGPHDYAPVGGPGRFRRGQVLPPAERGYVVGDYYRYHLRRPPPGYYWYRNGDDFVLAAIASGLIFEVVAGDGY